MDLPDLGDHLLDLGVSGFVAVFELDELDLEVCLAHIQTLYLVTKESYGNFQLTVEFWPSPDANSGVYIRCQNPEEIKAESGYEINIYDTNENPDNRTGAIIHFTPPMTVIEAGGQWNTYEITAEGSHIVVHLNGTLVAELEDASYASGPIALQNNGGLIRFRNVQVKPL